MIEFISMDIGRDREVVFDLREKNYLNLWDEGGPSEYDLHDLIIFLRCFKDRFLHFSSRFSIYRDRDVYCKIGFSTGLSYDFGLTNGNLFYEMLTDSEGKCLFYYDAGDEYPKLMASELSDILLKQSCLVFDEGDSNIENTKEFREFLEKTLPRIGFVDSSVINGFGQVVKKVGDKQVCMPISNMGSGYQRCIRILWMIYNALEEPGLFIIPCFTSQLHPLTARALYMVLEETGSKLISTFQCNIK